MPELISGRYKPEQQSRLRGNFGEVLVCSDLESGTRAALKIALADDAGRPFVRGEDDTFASIRSEASVLASLNHRNIVGYTGQGEWNGRPYLALEFLEGTDLFRLRRSDLTLSLEDRVDIVVQAARGVEAVHSAGFVHLDIKPENFFYCVGGRVALIDFGTARRPVDAPVPGAGEAVTPAYSAPEQYPRSPYATGAVTAATDIFAFAILAFEMLSGQHPFGGDDSGVGLRICHESARGSLNQYLPNVPEYIHDIIARSFCKRVKGRQQNMSGVRERFENWLIRLREEQPRRPIREVVSSGESRQAAENRFAFTPTGHSENPEELAITLKSFVEIALGDRDTEKARSLLESIETELLTGTIRTEWEALRLRISSIEEGRQRIPTLIDRTRKLAEEGSWRLHDLTLSQAIQLDPEHPELIDYRIARLGEALMMADNLWELGKYTFAVNSLRAIEETFADLTATSVKAARVIDAQRLRWRMGALDGFQIRSRLGDSKGVEDLFVVFHSLLDHDPEFLSEVQSALAESGVSEVDSADKIAARIGDAISQECFGDASDQLRAARMQFPDKPHWEPLAARLRTERENSRLHDKNALALATEARAAISAATFSDARTIVSQGELLRPGWALWEEIRGDIEIAETRGRESPEHEESANKECHPPGATESKDSPKSSKLARIVAGLGLAGLALTGWYGLAAHPRYFKSMQGVSLSVPGPYEPNQAAVAELDPAIPWSVEELELFTFRSEIHNQFRQILVTPKPDVSFPSGHHVYNLRIQAELVQGKKTEELIPFAVDVQLASSDSDKPAGSASAGDQTFPGVGTAYPKGTGLLPGRKP